MTDIQEIITSIVSDLNQGGFTKEADELQNLTNLAFDKSISNEARKEVLNQIQMRCHIKWLGDLYLSHLSQEDWWGKLEKLARSTKKKMHAMQDRDPL